MTSSMYISSLSKLSQSFSHHILPHFREKLEGISASLDVITEENRMLGGIIPARTLQAVGNIIKTRLNGRLRRLELRTEEMRDKIQNLEHEFCGGQAGIWWFTSAISQIFAYIGLLFGLNEPWFHLLQLGIEFNSLEDDIIDLAEARDELLQRISALEQIIHRLHAQVFPVVLEMPGSLAFRVQRSPESGTRGRN